MARTSTTLLQRLGISSDAAAWERFVDIYGPLIHGWLRRFGLQEHDAKDVAQDVLLTVVREMPTFQYDPQRGTFRGWLRGIVVNRLRGYWKKRRRQSDLSPQWELQLEEFSDPGSALASRWNEEYEHDVVCRVARFLRSEFETKTWQAFWRVVVEGDSPAETAAALGLTVNAVYLAKSRVLRRLRQESDGLLE